MLSVKSLAQATYKVSADGKVLGSFTADELAKGIDLALLDTPNRKRAEDALETALKIHSCNGVLRSLEQCRQIAFKSKFYTGTPDPKNFNAVYEALQKWRDSFGPDWLYRKYYGYQIESYRKNAPKEAELTERLENVRVQLEKDALPAAYVIAVEKLSDI